MTKAEKQARLLELERQILNVKEHLAELPKKDKGPVKEVLSQLRTRYKALRRAKISK